MRDEDPGLAGEYPGPSGERTGPSGERTGPSGERTGPSGERAGRRDEHRVGVPHPPGSTRDPAEVATAPPRRARLALDGPLEQVAGDDRPETWGDPSDTDAQRLAEYLRNTPPHHG